MIEPTSDSREERLNEVLAAYLQAADAGQAPEPQELLAQHPDLADELAVFLSNQRRMEMVAVAPDPDATLGAGEAAGVGTVVRYVGDYEILKELARGGMGVIYEARQVSLNRIIALKMIRGGDLASDADVRRFRAEAEAVANLEHPNIVPIYEVGEHEGQHYFSMKLIGGGSLACRIKELTDDPNTAVRLLATVARAVHHAHQRGIFHRDLKPANILLDWPDQSDPSAVGNLQSAIPLVTDFGLAKRTTAAGGMTHSGAIVGTPSYMAPEQAGAKKDLTTAVDVYSLGAILYEMLTGRPPFLAATPLDTLMQVLHQEPERPGRIHPKIARDLETICLKCLDKDAQRRFGSALELADDLERWLRGEPILALPAGRCRRALKWARRNKGLSSGLAAAVLALVVGAALSSWQAVKAWTAAKNEAAQRFAADAARKTAVEQKKAADELRDRAEALVYAGKLALAQREIEDGNLGQALNLLEQCQGSLRGWEHRYLLTRFNALQTFRGHTNPVSCVTFRPDDKRLASAGWDGTVMVWDVATGKIVLNFRGHHGQFVHSLCFSPDGKRIASTGGTLAGNGPGEVKIWDAETGIELFDLKGHTDQGVSVSFSPDGKVLASASADGTVKVWDAEKGVEVITLKWQGSSADAVCFSPDGKRLACSGMDVAETKGRKKYMAVVKLWDVATWQPIKTFEVDEILSGLGRRPTTLTFSPSGARLAVATLGAASHGISILDAETGKEMIPAIQTHAFCIAFSADGKRLASGDATGNVRVWDAESGRQLLLIRAHVYSVNSVYFSHDGKRLASAGGNDSKVWDAERGQDVITLTKPGSVGVNCIAFSPDRKHLAATTDVDRAASGNGGVVFWDLESRRLLWEKHPAGAGLTGVCWQKSADGDEKRIHLPGEYPPSVVCFRPGGKELVLAGGAGTAIFCDAKTGKTLRTLKGLAADIMGLCFSADGRRLVTAGGALSPAIGEVKVWDADTGDLILDLPGHSAFVESVCFSADGKRLASASWDGTVKIWDLDTGKEIRTLMGHSGAVTGVCFSPDGKRLATSSSDKTVKVWDAETGKVLFTLEGHSGRVRCVCFCPDGTRLASGGDDHTVRVWDADRGLEVLTLAFGGQLGVLSVSFSADGARLAAGGAGQVKIWEARSN